MHMTQRLWEWNCRTVDHIPLRLADLDLTSLPVERIPDGVKGLNLSRTKITNPRYPARMPKHVRSLQHNGFTGTTLQDLDTTNLRNLVLADCPNLETLGPLPSTLRQLAISHCPKFIGLPALPEGLTTLRVDDCRAFKALPHLPKSLDNLCILETGVTHLPNLPEDIQTVYIPHECLEARLLNFRWGINSIGWPSPSPPIATRVMLLLSFHRTKHRLSLIKEELMASTWHPNRVSAWLEAGEDVLDMMMGC